jgi:serine/threonine protein kinase
MTPDRLDQISRIFHEALSRSEGEGALPLDRALAIARQIADAIDAAHESGIRHRDLKPANIKVRPDGEPTAVAQAPAVAGNLHLVAGRPRDRPRVDSPRGRVTILRSPDDDAPTQMTVVYNWQR